MDSSTPPPSKSASRLSQPNNESPPLNHLTTESPKLLPLREHLLLLSPSPSPQTRSKTRLIERLDIAEEPSDLLLPKRRCKGRASPMGVLACASPRNNRRSRRRLEQDREDKEGGTLADENVKPRKRRQTGRPRKDKLTLVPASSNPSPKTAEDDDLSSLDHMVEMVFDLIMWKDVAKSTLWFGFGSVCILSSCFTTGLKWSVFSMTSQLGLIFLAISFFCNSFSKRNKDDIKCNFKLTEEDILRLARLCLPATNLIIAKTGEVFSGNPSTTLKVAPFLLFGAEYGHLITIWRLCALGFLISFTVPRLYSCYSVQINNQVQYWRSWVWEAWGACTHKKVIAASAATVFWNLSSVKTRIFTAFISAVILRYIRQKSGAEVVEGDVEGEQGQKQQDLVAEEDMVCEQRQQQQALVVVEDISLA